MKKSSKILLIIVIVLVVLIAGAGGVLYYFYPEQVKFYLNTAWEWMNKPLPIVGISSLMIIVILWRMIASSAFGKAQLMQFKDRTKAVEMQFVDLENQSKEILEKYEKEYQGRIEELQHKVEEYRLLIKKLCETIPNKKVKAIGETINGEERKETINNETKAE